MFVQVVVSQILIIWSYDPDAMNEPLGENATVVMPFSWDSIVRSNFPEPKSQSLTVQSLDPVASIWLSGVNARV